MLTGKCKEDFEKYIRLDYELTKYGYRTIKKLPLAMQYGVLVDFFDSVGIDINDEKDRWVVNYSGELCESRQEAREQAIKKANEIYKLCQKN